MAAASGTGSKLVLYKWPKKCVLCCITRRLILPFSQPPHPLSCPFCCCALQVGAAERVPLLHLR